MSEPINEKQLVEDAFSDDWEKRQIGAADIIDICEEDGKYIPKFAPLIEKHLSGNTSEKVRASELLGKIKAKSSVSKIQALLKDPDIDVREYAAKALGWIGDEGSVNPLIVILKDEDDEVRECAARALGEIGELTGNKQAVDSLIEATRDEDIEVRLEAGIALGKLGDEKAVDALISLLSDSDIGVVEGASQALTMFGEKTIPKLEEVSKTGSRRQKKYAERLIKGIKAGKTLIKY